MGMGLGNHQGCSMIRAFYGVSIACTRSAVGTSIGLDKYVLLPVVLTLKAHVMDALLINTSRNALPLKSVSSPGDCPASRKISFDW